MGIAALAGVSVTAVVAWRADGIAEKLRTLRIDVQRAAGVQTSLERGQDRLAALGMPLDALQLAIVEASDRIEHEPGVRSMARRLGRLAQTVPGPLGASAGSALLLRLELDVEVAHAGVLIEVINELRMAAPGRPIDVVGCRVERLSIGKDGPSPLRASCALDWPWWPLSGDSHGVAAARAVVTSS